jgi:hypothetical protein
MPMLIRFVPFGPRTFPGARLQPSRVSAPVQLSAVQNGRADAIEPSEPSE